MRSASGRRCSRLALLGLTAVLVGAACSDPPPAAKPPKVSTAGSATRSATPTPTTPEQEVEAAVRAYYAELTRAAQTADTSGLRRIASPGCPCYGAVPAIEADARKGLKTPEAIWTVRAVNVHDIVRNTAAAQVAFDVNAYELVDEHGSAVSRIPARRERVDLSFVKQGGLWIATNVVDLGGR
jgi:hypothetical protein